MTSQKIFHFQAPPLAKCWLRSWGRVPASPGYVLVSVQGISRI